MPAPSDKPLRRVSMHLFADDVALLERRYGRGWSEQVRLLVERDNKNWRSLRATLDATEEEA